MTGCRLFTGTTGLVGQYLLWEALLRRESVCILVRPRRGVDTADRVDRTISVWEKRFATIVPRPIIVEGDLRIRGLGLSQSEADWFRHNVNSVVHGAASVLFKESSTGEPMKSNTDGTRNLLELCTDSQVQDVHYISTAYACGEVAHSETVIEQLYSRDVRFRNVYERSKCMAEHLVVECKGNFTRTIHRPSIIIGESKTGYSPSFNAIYTPLRLAWTVLRERGSEIPLVDDFLDAVGAHENLSKNLVPVDWVSQAIGSIIRQPSCHGGIYHLTNPVPTETREIIAAMVQTVTAALRMDSGAERTESAQNRVRMSGFADHMETYRSYFQSDPKFDNSRLCAASVCGPCPTVDREALVRTFEFAIRSEFNDHEKISEIVDEKEPRRQLKNLVRSHPNSKEIRAGDRSQPSNHASYLNGRQLTYDMTGACFLRLLLAGTGGGCWQIAFLESGIRVGIPNVDDCIQFYSSAAAFRIWLQGTHTLDEMFRSGAFVVTGNPDEMIHVPRLMLALHSMLTQLDKRNDNDNDLRKRFVLQGHVGIGE